MDTKILENKWVKLFIVSVAGIWISLMVLVLVNIFPSHRGMNRPHMATTNTQIAQQDNKGSNDRSKSQNDTQKNNGRQNSNFQRNGQGFNNKR